MRLLPLLALALAGVAPTMLQAADYVVGSYGPFKAGMKPSEAAATLQRAIDACAAAGGGRVVVASGPAVTIGTIRLKSHVELHLERGAVLLGSPVYSDFNAFAPWPVQLPADRPVFSSGVIVAAEDADDVAITGPGTIDGNSPAYVSHVLPEIDVCPNERPFAVVFTRCTKVTVRDLTIKDSPFWTLRMLGCDDVAIDGCRILGDRRMPNNDGIDIDWTSNVRITGCHVVTGDDCISLKTSPAYTGAKHPCENIIVANCTLSSKSSAIAVGCDVQGPIRNAVFENLTITDSHRGLTCRLSCDGSIEHLVFSNIVIETRLFDPAWWGRAEPIQILAMPWTKDYKNGVIRDIRFSHITARGENGVVIVSNESGHISDIRFDDVSLSIDKTTTLDGSRQDFRPNEVDPMPTLPVSGYLIRHADGIHWTHCDVTWGAHRPDYFRHLVDAEDTGGLELTGLSGPSADPAHWPAFRLVRSGESPPSG